MADLEPLMRYRKHQLDEKQKILANLYGEAEKLLTRQNTILDEIEREKEAATSPDFQHVVAVSGFGHFLLGSRTKLKELQKQQDRMELRITIALNDMRETFGDLKKIEITHQNRLERERKKLQKREDALFEEIGLQIFSKNAD